MEVIDCSNYSQPIEIASYKPEWQVYRLTVIDDRIYLDTIDGGGVRILNITTLTHLANNSIFGLYSLFLLPLYSLVKRKLKRSNWLVLTK